MTLSMPQHMFLMASELSLICILWVCSKMALVCSSVVIPLAVTVNARQGRQTNSSQAEQQALRATRDVHTSTSLQARTLFIGIHSPHTNSTAR